MVADTAAKVVADAGNHTNEQKLPHGSFCYPQGVLLTRVRGGVIMSVLIFI